MPKQQEIVGDGANFDVEPILAFVGLFVFLVGVGALIGAFLGAAFLVFNWIAG